MKAHGKNRIVLLFFFLTVSMILFCDFNLSLAEVQEIIGQINISSSPNPVGSGARALGMGGAFIAIADDATAASWNPAGLIQLEMPEVSIVGAYFNRSMINSFTESQGADTIVYLPDAGGKSSVSEIRLNYFSISYPFETFNKNMIISLNYQNLYDFINKWNFSIHQLQDNGKLNTTQSFNAVQTGSLSAFGLAFCIEVIQNISLGMTFNFWEDGPFHKNQWEQVTNRKVSGFYLGTPTTGGGSYSKDIYDFRGVNFNFGLLWNLTGKLTFGAVLKTPFTADVKHEHFFSQSLHYSEEPDADIEYEKTHLFDEKLTMPMSYGIGIAYRMSDSLTLSADIYRTEWGDFIHEDTHGNKTSPITGTPESQADIDATHQVRLGAEYLFINPKYIIPLRGGVFYDPAPAQGDCDNYFGLSLGSGVAYKKYVFDIACQYRFGNDVGESISQSKYFQNTQDVKEYTIYSSLIVHF